MTRHLRFLLLFALLCGWTATGRATAPWSDTAWSRRLEITADPARIEGSGTFTDFTLVLALDAANHASVFANAKADGSDLVVTAGDGATVLPHEIVSYSAATQTAEIWVKVPGFSDSSNRLYLYYGNPSATIVPTPGQAWTPQHLAVYHFAEDPSLGVLRDYGPGGNFGTVDPANWSSTDVGPGAIGQGWTFNGENQVVDGDQISSSTGTYTISAWFSMVNLTHDANFAFSAEVGFWHLSAKRNGEQRFADLATDAGFIRWAPEITDSLLHQFVWTLDATADTARFYFDGVEQPVNARFVDFPPAKVYTGEVIQGDVGIAGPLFDNNPFDMLEGLADEFRVYEGLRSSAWIKTEYRNQQDPIGFFSYLEQTSGAAAAPVLTPQRMRLSAAPNPMRGTTEITVDGGAGALELAVYDIAGRRIRLLRAGAVPEGALRLAWDGRDDAGRVVGGGVYFIRARGERGSAGTKVLLAR